MMLAAQLWLGYLAAHPMWLTGAAIVTVGLTFILLIAGADMGDSPTPAHRDWQEFTEEEARRAGGLEIPLRMHLPAVPGAAVNITSPPAAVVPLFPAGDVPGPACPPSPGTDGAVPVHAAGPGTPPHEVWEPCCHNPVAPTGPLWSKQAALPGGER